MTPTISNRSNKKALKMQGGAVLILSLLLLSIMSLLSLSAMDSSFYAFKSQVSRLNYERATHNADSIGAISAGQIESFIKAQDWSSMDLPEGLQLESEGRRYLVDSLMGGVAGSNEIARPKKLFSYQSARLYGETYIANAEIKRLPKNASVMQFRSYDGLVMGLGREGSLSLYLEIHNVASVISEKGQKGLSVRTISDYQFVL